ncbi:MAG TPA: zf-HC2 domain-containing protein [Bryobacteraceae bacterium]|nr:zf-HC2 domain-containing protein [Bryobacteraceae bacterium]
MNCAQIREKLDSYLSRELPVEERHEMARHLDNCADCSADLATRTRLRQQLRAAVRAISVPAGLEAKVRGAVRAEPMRPRTGLWAIAAAAAVVIIVTGVGILRKQANPENAILEKTSGPLAAVVNVGLVDHLQCAVFRKYPRTPAPPKQLSADLGPQFAELAPLIQAKLPARAYIIEAHHCTAHGRLYTHFIVADGRKLVSLILTPRQAGEALGASVYQTGVDRFQVVGFESHGFLVYVISDMDATGNLQLSASLAPTLRLYLAAHAG